jgi:hypothetical protein
MRYLISMKSNLKFKDIRWSAISAEQFGLIAFILSYFVCKWISKKLEPVNRLAKAAETKPREIMEAAVKAHMAMTEVRSWRQQSSYTGLSQSRQ